MIHTLLTSMILFSSAAAFAAPKLCVPTFGGNLPLKLVNSVKVKGQPVSVLWNVDKDDNLIVNFDVNTPIEHEKNPFGPTDYPFQYDVVEIFFAANDPKDKDYKYFELEVTPHNQTFNVLFNVVGGKTSATEGVDYKAQTVATIATDKKSWSVVFSIPLKELGWSGDLSHVRGNFYSIIGKDTLPGKANNRKFWSTFLPKTTSPNFNKPEYFKPLFECK